jgi:hypothetical protein
MAMTRPFIVLDPVEVPGWGQVHGGIIDDAATRAKHALKCIGVKAALGWLPALDEMIEARTWRSAAAFDIRQAILRVTFSEIDVTSVEMDHETLTDAGRDTALTNAQESPFVCEMRPV